MKQLRLWPQSLVGQIIILVAIALFVAQAINFGLLLRERNRVELTSQTAPLVYRVINALDTRPDRAPDRDHPRANQDRDRRNIDFFASRPTLSGKPRPDVAGPRGLPCSMISASPSARSRRRGQPHHAAAPLGTDTQPRHGGGAARPSRRPAHTSRSNMNRANG